MFAARLAAPEPPALLNAGLTLLFLAGTAFAIFSAVFESDAVQRPKCTTNTTETLNYKDLFVVQTKAQCDEAAWPTCASACPTKCKSTILNFDTVYASSIWHQQAPWCGFALTKAKFDADLVANGGQANGLTQGPHQYPSHLMAPTSSCAANKYDDECKACSCEDSFISSPARCKGTICDDKEGCASGEASAEMHHPLTLCKANCQKKLLPAVSVCTFDGATGTYSGDCPCTTVINGQSCTWVQNNAQDTTAPCFLAGALNQNVPTFLCYNFNTIVQCEAACKAGKAPYCPAIEQKGMFRLVQLLLRVAMHPEQFVPCIHMMPLYPSLSSPPRRSNVTVEVCIPPVTLQQSIISYLGVISLGMSALSTVFQSYSDFALKKLAAKTVNEDQSSGQYGDA
jgi:hypothetical protein